MKKDLISIVIPCYNCEKIIERCLNSILLNSYKNIEIICVNDGSKDNTLSELKKISKKDNRICVVDKINGGAASARNEGLKISKGKYIMFIDSDDYIGENYILNYYKEISINNLDMVVGGYTRLDEQLNIKETRKLNNKPFNTYKLLSPWARIINRKFLIDNNIIFLPYDMGEDVYFCMKILLKTDRVKAIDDINYYYIYNDSSLTSTKFQDFKISQIPLLEAINKEKVGQNILFNYFMNRYVVYYLLTFGKNVSPYLFKKETKSLYLFLKNNNIKKIFPFRRAVNGDDFKIRLIVTTFNLIYKFKLVGLFAKIYCKNKYNKERED